MTPEEAEKLLRLVGADRIKRSADGQFLHCRCPFAPYRTEHTSNVDRKPSAWVSLTGRARFGCWTCTADDLPLSSAIGQLNALAGGKFSQAVRRAQELDKTTGHVWRGQVYLPTDVTDDYQTNYYRPQFIPTEFLAEKGVTKRSTIEAFKTGVDLQRGLVLFPIIDHSQIIVGAQARQFVEQTTTSGKYFSVYPNTRKSHHLFGEHLLKLKETHVHGTATRTLDAQGIIVFEGPLDCMHAYDVGLRNVVALMGAHLSVEQARKLFDLCGTAKSINLILDPDAAGEAGARHAASELILDTFANANVYTFRAPKDPKKLTKQDFIELLTKEREACRKRTAKDLVLEMLRAGRKRTTRQS